MTKIWNIRQNFLSTKRASSVFSWTSRARSWAQDHLAGRMHKYTNIFIVLLLRIGHFHDEKHDDTFAVNTEKKYSVESYKISKQGYHWGDCQSTVQEGGSWWALFEKVFVHECTCKSTLRSTWWHGPRSRDTTGKRNIPEVSSVKQYRESWMKLVISLQLKKLRLEISRGHKRQYMYRLFAITL